MHKIIHQYNTFMKEADKERKIVAQSKYLQVNPRDILWGLAVTTVGFQHIHKGDPYPLVSAPDEYNFTGSGKRTLNEYQLVYITRGHGYFESASCSRTKIEAGMMFMLFPGEWHTFAPDPETGWDDHWSGFNGGFMDDKIKSGFFTFKNCVFKVGVDEKIINAYHEIYDIVSDCKKGFQQAASSIAISLIGRLHYEDMNRAYGDTYIIRIINQAKAIMKEDMVGNQALEDIASSLGISYSFFRREFKRKCGISPGQFRLEQKLTKAKELLENTNMSIAEISSRLHFDCIGQFSTFFKKKTGTPPLEYRKNGIKKD